MINGFSYKELFDLAINKPSLAQIEITQNCNQNCSFCFKNCSQQIYHSDLPLKEWKKVIKILVKFGIEKINFTGGEPFLYKDFLSLVDYAKKIGIKEIIVNSNGLVDLSSKNLINIDTLVISVHGLEKMHNKIVKSNRSFTSLLNNIKIAKSQKIAVAINMVVFDDNIDSMLSLYNFLKKFNLAFYSFNLAGDENGVKNLSKNLFTKYFDNLKRIYKKAGTKLLLRHGMQNVMVEDKDFFIAQMPLPHCAAGKYKILVNYRGDIFPCSFFQSSDFFCGNILKDDIKDIWEYGRGFKFFRNLALNKIILPIKCNSCFKKDKCLGGCLVWRKYSSKKEIYERDTRCQFGAAHVRARDY